MGNKNPQSIPPKIHPHARSRAEGYFPRLLHRPAVGSPASADGIAVVGAGHQLRCNKRAFGAGQGGRRAVDGNFGVGGHVHFEALCEQVVDGLRDADVRLDAADDRLLTPVQIKALGTCRREDGLLDPRLVLEPHLGCGVAEAFGVLL